mgnify:CR=1 FL=1
MPTMMYAVPPQQGVPVAGQQYVLQPPQGHYPQGVMLVQDPHKDDATNSLVLFVLVFMCCLVWVFNSCYSNAPNPDARMWARFSKILCWITIALVAIPVLFYVFFFMVAVVFSPH